jgi:hypothetical protein
MVETKKILHRNKYGKSKAEKYQLARTASLGNLWVVDSIGHLGADGLVNLLQQCVGVVIEFTFGNKPLRGSCRKRHYHKPWFDIDCYMAKCDLRLWFKANSDLHVLKHQESKLKKLLKRKIFFWETTRAQHMCVLAKVDTLSFWKKYRPKAIVADKISAIAFLEGFHELVGQPPPLVRLQTDYLAQVTKPPPSHTLNANITLVELLQALKTLQRNKATGFGWYES